MPKVIRNKRKVRDQNLERQFQNLRELLHEAEFGQSEATIRKPFHLTPSQYKRISQLCGEKVTSVCWVIEEPGHRVHIEFNQL